MSYTYPLSAALSAYLKIQPDPAKILKGELLAFKNLEPEEQAKIAPLLKAGVPGVQAKALVQGAPIKYRMVAAMLAAAVPFTTISANLATIEAYSKESREAILVCLESGIAFDAAKTLVDRLK